MGGKAILDRMTGFAGWTGGDFLTKLTKLTDPERSGERQTKFARRVSRASQFVGGSGKAVAGHWWLVFVAAVCDRRRQSGGVFFRQNWQN